MASLQRRYLQYIQPTTGIPWRICLVYKTNRIYHTSQSKDKMKNDLEFLKCACVHERKRWLQDTN